MGPFYIYIDNGVLTECEIGKDKELQEKILIEIFRCQDSEILQTPALFMEYYNLGSFINDNIKDSFEAISKNIKKDFNALELIRAVHQKREFLGTLFKQKMTIDLLKNAKDTKKKHELISDLSSIEAQMNTYLEDMVDNSDEYQLHIEVYVLYMIMYAISSDFINYQKNCDIEHVKNVFNVVLSNYPVAKKGYRYDVNLLFHVIFCFVWASRDNNIKKFKNGQDLMDIEGLNLLFFGSWKNGKQYPVRMITKDKNAILRARKINQILQEHFPQLIAQSCMGTIWYIDAITKNVEEVRF